MFKWFFGLFKSQDISDNDYLDDEIVPINNEHNVFILNDEDNEEQNMPIEVLKRESVDQSQMFVEDQFGNQIEVTPDAVNRMLHRPDNFDGLPGLSKPNPKKQTPNRQAPPQHISMQPPPQQVYHQQPIEQMQPQPQYAPQPQYQYAPQYNGTTMPPPQYQPPQYNAPVTPQRKYPAYEIYTIDNEYVLDIDLPGIDESSLNIEYMDGFLTVSGNRYPSTEKQKDRTPGRKKKIESIPQDYHSTIPEYLMGEFSFEFPIKKQIDEASISADYNNGVLKINLPHRVKGDKVTIGIGKKRNKPVNTPDSPENEEI